MKIKQYGNFTRCYFGSNILPLYLPGHQYIDENQEFIIDGFTIKPLYYAHLRHGRIVFISR